jgi:hypothetical protein
VPLVVWCLHGTAIRPFDLLRASAKPLLAGLAAAALAYAARTYWDPVQLPFARLVLDTVIMGSVYAGAMISVMGTDFYLDLIRATRNAPSPLAASEMPAGAGASVAAGRMDGGVTRPVVMAET